MCGIAGIISLYPSDRDPLTASLRSMTDAIMHRGPDGEGFWINENSCAALGHRRLKVIDMSENAAQPMHYAGRYTITYNGEIYNYKELRNELVSKKYVFKTNSDTEVILAAYDCWKESCPGHFDGMFAFAIWDNTTNQLFCARDRFGEKPFYYFRDEDQFLFASEMKALWAAGVQRKIQNNRLLNYITTGLVQDAEKPDSTFFESIFSLPAGHHLKLQLPSFDLHTENYWDIDKETTDHGISENEAIEKFYNLLQASVLRRLRSDVTVGASLSGGLDSSSIVACICALQAGAGSKSDLQSFSAVFPGFDRDESGYMKEMIRAFPVSNFQTTPLVGQLLNDFDELIHHQEEPFQSLSIYAQYKVYELAKQQGVTVLLEGQGADEILAGYHKYFPWYWQELLRENPKSLRDARNAGTDTGIDVSWGFKNKLAARLPELAARHLQNKAYRQQSRHPDLERDFFSAHSDRHSLTKPAIRKLNDILYFHTFQTGLPELLRYADRNSMAHGREARLPFLNHELVQFIFSLPAHLKIKNGWTKWVLRKSMSDKLPPPIVWRKDKIGFEPPQQEWMQDNRIAEKIMESRKKLVTEHILKPSVMQRPVVAQPAHQEGNDDFRYLCAASFL